MPTTHVIGQLFDNFVHGDAEWITGIFPGPVAIDTPLSGAVDGRDALTASLEQEGYWWQERVQSIDTLTTLENAYHDVVELRVNLRHKGKTLDLPVAVFGQKSGGGYGQIRIYHSTWPLTGSHLYRAPIVWPDAHLDEPEVIGAYFDGLWRGDTAATLSLFSENA